MAIPVVYYGAIVNPLTLTSYEAIPNCLLAVGSEGNIDWIVHDVEDSLVQETLLQKGYTDVEVIPIQEGQFLMPGFIDTHTHAPQVPNIGTGQQYELLDWLENITFPMESKFADVTFAKRTYLNVVKRIIDSGTTTCCYYATLHLDASIVLADIVHSFGQRAFIGKCNMDRNCPSHYIEDSPESSIRDTKALVAHIRSLDAGPSGVPLVLPIITPRFAISCTSPLLSSLGELAASDPSLHIQTHISENKSEIQFTKSLFPGSASYAAVYDTFGLLRNNTILAHAVHLEHDEIELVAKRKTGISHCPTSNFNLSSGVAPVGRYLDKGIKVGLGTDVSGGFSPSILRSIQHASIASKIIAMQNTAEPSGKFTNRQLSVATLLYLATLGGAEVCALDHQIGSFALGKSFDALLVDVKSSAGNPALWAVDSDATLKVKGRKALEGMLESFFFCGDDRNISSVYVQGRRVGGRAHS